MFRSPTDESEDALLALARIERETADFRPRELWQPDRQDQLAAVETLLASPIPREVRLHLRDLHADLTQGKSA